MTTVGNHHAQGKYNMWPPTPVRHFNDSLQYVSQTFHVLTLPVVKENGGSRFNIRLGRAADWVTVPLWYNSARISRPGRSGKKMVL